MRRRSYPIILFSFGDEGSAARRVAGRDAETLLVLVRRAEKGVTAFDFVGGPAFRLAAYIGRLRKTGLDIKTLREAHDCGSHGRYVLRTPVEIHEVDTGEANEQ